MALGTANISTDLVGTTLGTSSRDVGTLCAGSITDINTPAFYVTDYANNGGKIDGEMLTASRPKWNIWSNASPGEWFINSSGVMSFRLKRNPYGTTPAYCYGLHYFAGYNHAAGAPILRILENPLKVYLGSNYIPVTFRLDLFSLRGLIIANFPSVTHINFDVIRDGVTVSSDLKTMPTTYPFYIEFYKEYNNVTTSSGYIQCKITLADEYGTEIASLGDILNQEIYRENFDINGRRWDYIDNYDGAWIKQTFINSYSGTDCDITGSVEATGYTVVNGNVLIPTGSYTDNAFVNITITRKSTSYTNVSFDITFDGIYTQRYTKAIQNGTSLLEPNTNSTIAVDGAEHWYTINNITFS